MPTVLVDSLIVTGQSGIIRPACAFSYLGHGSGTLADEGGMLVLGVETSCDETAVALYNSESGLLGERVFTQQVHAEYGGVVPELASRDHVRKLLPLLKDLLAEHELQAAAIDAVAYTAGPGLVGALLVGAGFGRSLAWALQVPALAVHHLEGHLLATGLEADPPDMPFLALLVSGGHTLLVRVDGIGDYEVIGQSLDDAVGEAFDKTAKLLGLGYPGGPEVAALAKQGDVSRWRFPRPMVDRPGLDMSFSGLKTFVLTTWRDCVQARERANDPAAELDRDRADVCACFEQAVVDTLIIKCRRAMQQTGFKRLVIAGGVGANQALRLGLAGLAKEMDGRLFYPQANFCTDNAAMIAYAGTLRLLAGESQPVVIEARPRWDLSELSRLA